MFGNNGYSTSGNAARNTNNQVSVNTTLHTFYSDYSCMRLTGWNENISFRFYPVIQNPDSQTGRNYDFQNSVTTALGMNNVMALKTAIDKKILPVVEGLENGITPTEPVSVAVSIESKNKRNILSVAVNSDSNNQWHVFLNLYLSVGENNQAQQDADIHYMFNDNVAIANYDPTTGKYAGEIPVRAEFRIFYDMLKKATDFIPFEYHATKYSEAISNRVTSSGGFGGFSKNNSNQNNQFSGSEVSNFSAPTTTITNTADSWLNS